MNGEGFAYFRWHQLKHGSLTYRGVNKDCRTQGCFDDWRRLQKRARPC